MIVTRHSSIEDATPSRYVEVSGHPACRATHRRTPDGSRLRRFLSANLVRRLLRNAWIGFLLLRTHTESPEQFRFPGQPFRQRNIESSSDRMQC